MARETMMWNWVKLYKCKDCWIFLPRDRFYKNVYWYDCISNVCKECNNKRSAKWKRENKEKRNAYQKKYAEERLARMEIYGTTEVPKEDKYKYLREQDKKLPNPYELKVEAIETEKKNDVILTPSINEWDPVITNNIDTTKTYTMSSKWNEISNRLTSFIDKIEKETEELEKEQIDYEKEYPDAYQKIMSDEDLSRAFNYKYNEEQKIELLKREQSIIDRKKDAFEYKTDKDKMRAMYDSLLDEQEKKKFDEAINELWWEWQDKFVHRLWKLPTHQFKNNWKNIYDNILELKNWEKKEKDVIL